jgi:PASTA domain-containing protein
MGRGIAAGLGAIACLCASAAPAAADTATFGSNLQGTQNLSILASAGAMNLATTTGVRLDAPVDGVINSWAVRSGDLNSRYSIAVLRPTAGGGFNVVSVTISSNAVLNSSDVVRPYTAPSIPIRAGDFIGLDNLNPSLPIHQSGNAGDVLGVFPGHFAQGAILATPPSSTGRELLVQATETYCAVPDVRGQKVAAAIQLLATHDCFYSVRKKKVKKKRKKNKVLAQSPAPGAAMDPTTPVGLTVGKLKKPKK